MVTMQATQHIPLGRFRGFGPEFPNGAPDGSPARFRESDDIYKVSPPATGRGACAVSHPGHAGPVPVTQGRHETRGGGTRYGRKSKG
jgi:hypothetical protein